MFGLIKIEVEDESRSYIKLDLEKASSIFSGEAIPKGPHGLRNETKAVEALGKCESRRWTILVGLLQDG